MSDLLHALSTSRLRTLLVVFAFMAMGTLSAQDQTDTTITCVVTNNTTAGGADGTAALSIVNLEFPISYTWQTSPPQSTATITDLVKGVYPVIFTDANGYTDTAECAVGEPYNGCYQGRTQTQGGWGQKARGNNPGSYRDANFASAFPNGLTIGCASGYTITLTSAGAVQDFLPQGKTPAALTGNLTDPTRKNYKNVLSGQVAALALSVGFDFYDGSFGNGTQKLAFQKVASGQFAGKTIEEVLDIANEILGGCNTSYSYSDINNVVSQINENFVDGKKSGGFIECVPTAGGFIGDFVWEDTNGNGTWQSGETGLSGVVVELWYEGFDGVLGTSDDVYSQTTTASNGSYGFSNLMAGDYRVEVNTVQPNSLYLSTNNVPKYVTLNYNQSYLYADFGFEPHRSAIGDRVWLDYNGDGVQDSGEPGLENATVTITDGNGYNDSDVTDVDGNYYFDNLPAGTYTVTIQSSSINLTAGYVHTTATSYTQTLAVDQAYVDADFGIRPVGSGASNTASIGDFVWYDTDGDANPDFSESGIGGVVLSLVYANFDGIIGTSDDISYPVAITSGGSYTFSNLYPGVYEVSVVANVPANYIATTSTTMTVTLSEGQNYVLADFGYNEPVSTIRGTVWNDKDGDGYFDSGEPVEANIEVELFDGTTNTTTGMTQLTAADGSYAFNGLANGTYYVKIKPTTFPGNTYLVNPGYTNGTSCFDKSSNNTPNIVLTGNQDEIKDAGIFVPGQIDMDITKNRPFVPNQFTPVTYTWIVTNSGGIPLNASTLVVTDADMNPVYASGDANSNGKIENTETWIYAQTRTWTWAPPTRNIIITTMLDVDDEQGVMSSTTMSETILVIGANMELSADKAAVCPGDTVNVTMTMRMKNSGFVPSGEDAQLTNVQYSSNLLDGGVLKTAGPSSNEWADASGDYVSTTTGAAALALDADDYVDNDNGFGEADWVHTYSYVVPANQSGDLVITGYDECDFQYYDGSSWTTYTNMPQGMDTLIVPLSCTQAMQADEDLLTTIISGSDKDINDKSVDVDVESPVVYPNPFTDRVAVQLPSSWTSGKAIIYNEMGSMIQEMDLTNTKTFVDVSTEVAGVYYIKITDGTDTYVHLMIKE